MLFIHPSWSRRIGWRCSSISTNVSKAYAALIGEADKAIGTVMTKLHDLRLEEKVASA